MGLFDAAVEVRRNLGRLNDLIHATAILLVLPQILEEGERVVVKPSLAAGNSPAHPYDLETNLRVAEFKLGQWKGADAMRKRQVFKDLVHLAADDSGREPHLYLVGQLPVAFLTASDSTAEWALDRHPKTRALFAARLGPLTMKIAEFTSGPASRVRISDLTAYLPALAELAGNLE